MKKPNNILVTGCAGFIGSHLLEDLINNTENDHIVGIDDLSTGRMENIKNSIDYITFIRGSTLPDKTESFDIIYHLASKVNNRSNELDDLMYNITLTLDTIKYLKPQGKFYFTSSGTVYGEGRNLKEDKICHPITIYGNSKLMSEKIIQKITNNYYILRLGNVFGERQRGDCECGLIAIIQDKIKHNEILSVYNNGRNKRDYIHIQDVMYAISLLQEPGIYNIGSGRIHKTIDIVKASEIRYQLSENKNEGLTIQLNIDKIKDLGFKPSLNVMDYL